MRFPKALSRASALLAFLWGRVLVAHAADQSAPSFGAGVASIPFKHEPQSFAEQSLSTLFITLALLGVTIAALYYLRNYLAKKTGRSFLKPNSIQLKERARLSPQLTMYVVTYRDKEVLLAQTGNAVTAVAEFPLTPSATDPHHGQPT